MHSPSDGLWQEVYYDHIFFLSHRGHITQRRKTLKTVFSPALKKHQMFCVHTTPEEFKNAIIVGFMFEENSGGWGITWLTTVLSESSENEKPAFSNSSRLKSVFEKFRSRGGLLWTADLTGERKLHFQIFSALSRRQAPVNICKKEKQ